LDNGAPVMPFGLPVHSFLREKTMAVTDGTLDAAERCDSVKAPQRLETNDREIRVLSG
jgi:hypothetical protein